MHLIGSCLFFFLTTNAMDLSYINKSSVPIITPPNAEASAHLCSAVSSGNILGCSFVLEYGASVNAKDIYAQTPLMLAALNGYESIFRLLLNKGACLDGSALCEAAAQGNINACSLILKAGADINREDEKKERPLCTLHLMGIEIFVSCL